MYAICHWSSLNDVLLPGPDLLCDLIGTLIRFRLFPTAVCGDIEAMFMQVEVPVHEQNFLSFCGERVSLMRLKFFNIPDTSSERSLRQLALTSLCKK